MSFGGSSGSSGGGSGSGVTTNYLRYPPYLEEYHKSYVADVNAYAKAYIQYNPFLYSSLDVDRFFFNAGKTFKNYTSLYDRYNDLITNYSIDNDFDHSMHDTMSTTPKALVTDETKTLDTDLQTRILPKFDAGARNINSVNSSTYVLARALLFRERQRALARFSAELKYRLIPVAIERWKGNMNWRLSAISQYGDMNKLYLATRLDYTDQERTYDAKRTLWPFTLFEYRRAAIGGPTNSSGTSNYVAGEAGPSQGMKALSGVVGGAAMGAQMGGPYGAVIGGIAGGILGALS